jgi:hypothetical protein
MQDLIVSGIAAAALALLLRTLWQAGRRSSPCERCPKLHAAEPGGGAGLANIARRLRS